MGAQRKGTEGGILHVWSCGGASWQGAHITSDGCGCMWSVYEFSVVVSIHADNQSFRGRGKGGHLNAGLFGSCLQRLCPWQIADEILPNEGRRRGKGGKNQPKYIGNRAVWYLGAVRQHPGKLRDDWD